MSILGVATLLVDRRVRFSPDIIGHYNKELVIVERDARSSLFVGLDPNRLSLARMGKRGEGIIGGEENLDRLKTAGHIRADAAMALSFWKNPEKIPSAWNKEEGGVYFDGDIFFRPSNGYRFVLCLRPIKKPDGSKCHWTLEFHWLGGDWFYRPPSVVIDVLAEEAAIILVPV